jgi:class 3 adenylate cyclase
MACQSCGYELSEGMKFCPECGVVRVAPSSRPLQLGEWRHISVLFCDVVSSSEISQRLDPEDLNDLLQAYQTR